MGLKYAIWESRSSARPATGDDLKRAIMESRRYVARDRLEYGDHGLTRALDDISNAISRREKIALYADYDVDGVMSCVSWIWFLRAIGHDQFVYYIPDRHTEGYGVNLSAIKRLVEEHGARTIITMDTGVTAKAEAAWATSHGVTFVCTDHHTIQPDKVPDCAVLNPKHHPDPEYQELCGCGITFVLLRKLAQRFPVPSTLWTDLLALAGMATICDVVPLNGVNHKLARMGVDAISKSARPIFRHLWQGISTTEKVDETDVGFLMGPRINAVGRIDHARHVVDAFTGDDPGPMVKRMIEWNDERRGIQRRIIDEAMRAAESRRDDPILFLGGEWHAGVVGIAASKVAESFWRPTWLFERKGEACKGSARSIEGFDVTGAMTTTAALFDHYGGHRAAGGFRFQRSNEERIREALTLHATTVRAASPTLWMPRVVYDFELPHELINMRILDWLQDLKPYGNGFETPLFLVAGRVANVIISRDKSTNEPRHTFLKIRPFDAPSHADPVTVKFFGEYWPEVERAERARFLVAPVKNTFNGRTSLEFRGRDIDLIA